VGRWVDHQVKGGLKDVLEVITRVRRERKRGEREASLHRPAKLKRASPAPSTRRRQLGKFDATPHAALNEVMLRIYEYMAMEGQRQGGTSKGYLEALGGSPNLDHDPKLTPTSCPQVPLRKRPEKPNRPRIGSPHREARLGGRNGVSTYWGTKKKDERKACVQNQRGTKVTRRSAL